MNGVGECTPNFCKKEAGKGEERPYELRRASPRLLKRGASAGSCGLVCRKGEVLARPSDKEGFEGRVRLKGSDFGGWSGLSGKSAASHVRREETEMRKGRKMGLQACGDGWFGGKRGGRRCWGGLRKRGIHATDPPAPPEE